MKTNNVHTIRTTAKKLKVLLISDLHWDNPHCDRDLLRRHVERGAPPKPCGGRWLEIHFERGKFRDWMRAFTYKTN